MPLLTTKFRPPPMRPQRVGRPRLRQALNDGVRHRLTLISAPAGYGKSTLLFDWLEHADMPVAWLSLDTADNDLPRFLAYLAAALRTVVPALDEATSSVPGTPSGEAVLTALINDLAGVAGKLALVLDDYHLIHSEAVHRAVQFLLEHTPPQFHLVISSRTDPPLNLPRWRARGELTELRAADLRFTHDEVESFLNQVMELKLSPQDTNELERRTEGWIAGLQLAALSLRGRENVSSFIEVFTGTDRYVLDYLTEEVLIRQPDEVQNFLLLTSVLDRLCGPLCDAVTEQQGSQERLEALERANLFITPLDNQRHWYRYHAFFADLLEQRLTQARPDLPATLHLRASRWFETAGLAADALRHAVLAEDYARAAALIERHPRARAIRRVLLSFLRASEDGQALDGLLEQAVARGIPLEHRSRLLAAFEDADAAPTPDRPLAEGALEPLSERELEVLRLMAAGLPNKAIARRLDISLNTVKTHTKSINSKLNVSNRTQASAKAQELGLL